MRGARLHPAALACGLSCLSPCLLSPGDQGAPRQEEGTPASVFAERSRRVMRALLLIQPLLTPEEAQAPYRAVLRQRERLLLFRPRDAAAALGLGTGLGIALFGATTVLVARAPSRLRVLFGGPARLGPAVLEGGGLGAGFTWDH
jgi:hypothetical protein